MLYKFSLEPVDVIDGMDTAKTFEATSMIDALQQASNHWFRSKKVNTFKKDENNIITMRVPSLCGAKFGNVLGTLLDETIVPNKLDQ